MPDLPPGREDVFVVFVEGKPGREGAYRSWFAGSHMADMRALPGVASAHAYRLEAPEGAPPAELCAIYEFAVGAAVLETIGRAKGTDVLPHSQDQGRMVWRLFETVQAWPAGALPNGPVVLALLETPRGSAPPLDAGAALAAEGAAYVRALDLSPAQPSRGSEYASAFLVHWQAATPDPVQATAERLDRSLPGLSRTLLLATPIAG
jgi:hypothetical protein